MVDQGYHSTIVKERGASLATKLKVGKSCSFGGLMGLLNSCLWHSSFSFFQELLMCTTGQVRCISVS